MKGYVWFLGLLALVCTQNAYGHETLDAGGAGDGEIGIEEKTGQSLPGDLTFHDENGAEVRLKDLLGKPAILTLVYYTCEHICPLMLGGLAQALPRLDVVAGRDYRVITVSFDETDTPKIARDIKKNYIKAAGPGFPAEGWKFLTADREKHSEIDPGSRVSLPEGGRGV